jgi:hypothetical protein
MTALDELVDPRPGAAALSMTITERPFRANSKATDDPITPAPITTASHLLFIIASSIDVLAFNQPEIYFNIKLPHTQDSDISGEK